MMDLSFILALAMACGYGLAVMAALRLSRLEPAGLVLVLAVAIYIAGLATIIIAGWSSNFWSVSIAYWFLVFCFLMAFGAIYKSLSLRMLLMLLEAPQQSAPYESLARRYLKEQSFEDRLKVMADKGLAVEEGGRLALTEKGRAVASFARRLQIVFKIEKSG